MEIINNLWEATEYYNSNPKLNVLVSLFWVAVWVFIWFVLDYLSYFIIKPIGRKYIKEAAANAKKHTESQPPIEAKVINKTENEVTQRRTANTENHHNNNNVVDKPGKPGKAVMTPIDYTIRKFERSSWRFINFTLLFGTSFYLYTREEYSFTTDFWDDWPDFLSENLNIVYAMEVGNYIYACMVINLEPKQKDKYLMLSHHIISILLLIGSHCNSYHRVGVVVLLLTDISDPILEGAKAFQYMGFQTVADVGFNLFAAIFIICRNIIYPIIILYPAFFSDSWDKPGTVPMRWLLFLLQVLFFYWTAVIINIAWNLISGAGASDIRDEE